MDKTAGTTSRGVALVTGAARRIGRAIALELAAMGHAVGVHYGTSRDEALTVVAAIEARGGRAAGIAADLADRSAVEGLVPECVRVLGAPCCLVNSASIFLDDRIEALDPDNWDRQQAVNLRAPVLLAKSFAANLPAGSGGTIINIVDQRVWRLTPQFFSYTASKAGLWAVTQTLAQALAPRIRVNAVGPGPVLKSIHQSDAAFAAEAAATLLARATSPEEIAAAVRFILDAPSLTGQMIAVDAGQHLAWQTPDVLHTGIGAGSDRQ
jgi:NAD(P)-dependent dehydrogenase (short-subunit alcohol dehydrogenase family)